jgi:hypothetical protein
MRGSAGPTMLKGSMPATGRKVKVMREARRQLAEPARSAPNTTMEPTSRTMSSSARMSYSRGD